MKTQKQLFDYVWRTRDHVSEVSGKPLHPKGHWQWHWQFAHVLSKGTYPSFKLNPDNIMLMLPEEHESQERYELFNERKKALQRIYYESRKPF